MSKKQKVSEALDQCLVRLARGESVSQCLHDYPRFAKELRPLLVAAISLRRVPRPLQRPATVEIGYQRMMAALRAKPDRWSSSMSDRSDRSAVLLRRSGRSWWLGVVALLLLAAVGSLVLLQSGFTWRATAVRAEAVVAEAEGIVLRLPSGDRTWQPAKEGDRLSVGDRLQTADNGRAVVTLDDRYGADLPASAEIAILSLPSSGEASVPFVVYQEAGKITYKTLPSATLAVSSPATPLPRESLEVRSPVAVARADRAMFVMTVAADGATAVAVDEGEVTVMVGDVVQVTLAGEVTVVGAAEGEEPTTFRKGELPPGLGWGLGLEEDTAPPLGPPGDGMPPGLDDKDKDKDAWHSPPGLEGKEALPPGQAGNDHQPPGLDDKGGIPPGLGDKGGIPPGQENKDK